jgi:hypothetical protein
VPPFFYDSNEAVRSLFAPPRTAAQPPQQPPQASQWWQQPRSESEIAHQDLLEHGNQPLGVGRLEQSDPNADPGMNRLRPATGERTGDTFISVDPGQGEMQGDPSLRENIGFRQPQQATGFQPDFLSRLWQGISQIGDPEAESAAAASTAMEPVTGPYLKDVVTGQIARRGIPGVSPGWEGMSPEDIALAFSGGGLGTRITRGSGSGAGWFPTAKSPYAMTEGGAPSVSNVMPLETDQLVRSAIDAKANRNLLPGTRPRSGDPTPYDLAAARQRWQRGPGKYGAAGLIGGAVAGEAEAQPSDPGLSENIGFQNSPRRMMTQGIFGQVDPMTVRLLQMLGLNP